MRARIRSLTPRENAAGTCAAATLREKRRVSGGDMAGSIEQRCGNRLNNKITLSRIPCRILSRSRSIFACLSLRACSASAKASKRSRSISAACVCLCPIASGSQRDIEETQSGESRREQNAFGRATERERKQIFFSRQRCRLVWFHRFFFVMIVRAE